MTDNRVLFMGFSLVFERWNTKIAGVTAIPRNVTPFSILFQFCLFFRITNLSMLRKSPKYSNALTNITYNLFPQKTFQILISPFFLRYTNSLYFEHSQKYHFLFTTLYFFISPRDLFAHFLIVILETPFKRYDLPTQISPSSLSSSIRDEGRSRTKKSRSLFPERVVEEKRGGGLNG